MRWRVLATVNGKQRKRIFRTYAQARLLADLWAADQHAELPYLPTRLSPRDLHEAESLRITLSEMSLTFRDAEKWLIRHYSPPSTIEWATAISNYEQHRLSLGVTKVQVSNVTKAARRLARFLRRKLLGN